MLIANHHRHLVVAGVVTIAAAPLTFSTKEPFNLHAYENNKNCIFFEKKYLVEFSNNT
jgi:hypothetical protein